MAHRWQDAEEMLKRYTLLHVAIAAALRDGHGDHLFTADDLVDEAEFRVLDALAKLLGELNEASTRGTRARARARLYAPRV